MKVIPTAIPDVLILEPRVFGDDRGFFYESWNQRAFDEAVGREVRFVQDNHSKSAKGVLRGLHYQLEQPQGKLVRVASGTVFDVAVDVRRGSPTFGQWAGVVLDDVSQRQFYVPPGFAHGFLVMSETALFHYKCTNFYSPKDELAIRWDDPDIGIEWPIPAGVKPLLSPRDAAAAGLRACTTMPCGWTCAAWRPRPSRSLNNSCMPCAELGLHAPGDGRWQRGAKPQAVLPYDNPRQRRAQVAWDYLNT